MINFAIKRGTASDKERKAIHHYGVMNDEIKLNYFDRADQVPEDHIPLGTIDWVISVLGFTPTPKNYPDFLSHLLGRKTWETDVWPMEEGIFVKPLDKPKRFAARVTLGGYKGKKKPPYLCSEKVFFINEWRLYVANSKVIYTGWYQGEDDDAIPPDFDESVIPEGWCGAIDMGMTHDGRYLLVEAGNPYAMGWYGHITEGNIYAKFILEGWKYLLDKKEKV